MAAIALWHPYETVGYQLIWECSSASYAVSLDRKPVTIFSGHSLNGSSSILDILSKKNYRQMFLALKELNVGTKI